MKVLKELEVAERHKTIKNRYAFVAEKSNVARSVVCKWKKQQDELKKRNWKIEDKEVKNRCGQFKNNKNQKAHTEVPLEAVSIGRASCYHRIQKAKVSGIKS